jgi:hypothetical protein
MVVGVGTFVVAVFMMLMGLRVVCVRCNVRMYDNMTV